MIFSKRLHSSSIWCTFCAVRYHVVVDWHNFVETDATLKGKQSFYHPGSRMQIMPCPPSQYGLPFGQADFLQPMQDAKSAPGRIIYKYLLDSINPTWNGDYVICSLFFVHIVTNGNRTSLSNLTPAQSNLLTRDEATAFVDALVKVDVAEIPKDSMRCSHCWSYFDEEEEEVNNKSV
jgi:hypothetical protein